MKRLLAFALLAGLSALTLADSGGTVPLNAFSPPPGDTSVEALREVFGNLVGMVATGGDPNNAQVDDTLGAMMRIFLPAVVFIGFLFVGYTTIKGAVDSAHDGEILGRKMSSIWVPLRSMLGMGLILPVANGYCLLQIIVMWIALQGVGIADAVWSAGIKQIDQDNMLARPLIPDSRPLAANILRFEVCMAAMNKQFQDSGRTTRIEAVAVPRIMRNTGELTANYDVFDAIPVVGAYTVMKNLSNSGYTVVDFKWRANDNAYINPDVCGGITWKQSWEASEGNSNTKVVKGPILAAHAQAVQEMIKELRPVAQKIVSGLKPAPGALEAAAIKYENSLRAAAKTAVKQTNDRARSDFLKAADRGGWIFAGTWYNHIVKMNDVMQSTLNGLPSSEPIAISDKETAEALQGFKDVMTTANEYTKHRTDAVRHVYNAETDVRAPQEGEGAWEYTKKLMSAPFMGAINQMTQEIAGSNLNHISQMKSFGDTIVVTGEVLMGVLAVAAGFGSSVAGNVATGGTFDIGASLQILSGVFTALIFALLGFGVVLSTYIPMIPFITWMTSVVNWFVLLLEAILISPIWGVAHIHPDGDDAVGKGGHGWMMILSLLLRPALMIFGFIASMLLAQPIAGLINVAFMTVVSGIQADSMTGIVSFLAFVAIYTIVMTTVMHLAFSLIHFIPDNSLRWVGVTVSGLNKAEGVEGESRHVFAAGVLNAKQGAAGGGHGGPRGRPRQGGRGGNADDKGEAASKDAQQAEHLGTGSMRSED